MNTNPSNTADVKPSFWSRTWSRIRRFSTSKWGITLIVLVLIIVLYSIFHTKKSIYTFVPVTRGSITEAVSVTGNTTPTQSVSLGFQSSGVIARVNAAVGDYVHAGQVLASLNTSDLSAQLAQANANTDAQKAKLAGLQAGSRPEDIAASQAALAKAEQDLANLYGNVINTSNDAYAKANDAVRTQTNAFFSNPESANVQLNFQTSNSQAAIDAKNGRLVASGTLNDWQTAIAAISVSSSNSDFDALLQKDSTSLSGLRAFFLNVSTAVNGATSVDTPTLATYKASVATGANEINTAATNVTTLVQNIASQKLTVAQLKAQLDLKQAGSTQTDIDAQQAQVEQAQAAAQSVQAKINNSIIVSPIDGTVTQFDAKVGQVGSPGTALVSVISNSSFEVDAQVPETDIGRIAISNPVDMTFDAFPGEKFTGKIFYIDPAQTISQGVVDYKIKISFDAPDPRIKSGLTANLIIKTKTDDNALILPQYAVLQNDQGTFVKTLVGAVATQTPVTLGIQDQNGNVEILSGVSEGEQVINIGLK